MKVKGFVKDDSFFSYRYTHWQHITSYMVIACSLGSVFWVIKDILISGLSKTLVSVLGRAIPTLFLIIYFKFKNRRNFLILASIHIWLSVAGVVFIYYHGARIGTFSTSGSGWLMFLTLFFVVSIFSGTRYILINYIGMFIFVIVLYQIFPESLSVSTGEAYFTYVLISAGYILVNIFISRMFRDMYLYQNKFYKLSHTDQLTGLGNRRVLSEITDNYNLKQKSTIFTMDIDRFKLINDTYGHDIGDVCLVQTANILQKSFREKMDYIVRLGGDEFLVVCEGCVDTKEIYQRIQKLLKEDNPYNISYSIGVTLGDEGENIFNVLKRADSALYVVKSEGRNNIQVFEDL